jgi:hypothetical protein
MLDLNEWTDFKIFFLLGARVADAQKRTQTYLTVDHLLSQTSI